MSIVLQESLENLSQVNNNTEITLRKKPRNTKCMLKYNIHKSLE